MKLLHLDSSISGEVSASRQLSAAIVAAFAGFCDARPVGGYVMADEIF